MKGLEISVTNSDLVVKHEEKVLRLFVIFKDKKYGTKYIIFTDINGEELFFGSPLVNDKKLIIMKFKNIKDEEVVKEFVWKHLNNQELSNFELIEIPNILKLEVIDYNVLDVKKEVILNLSDIYFKKEEEFKKMQEEVKVKKNSKGSSFVIILFFLVLLAGGYYLYNNQELIYGKNIYVRCEKKYNREEVNAIGNEIVNLTFNNSKILKSHTKKITYTFNDNDIYYNFKEKNMEYKYFNEEGSKKYIDEELKFVLDISYDLNSNSIPNNYDDLFTYYNNLSYNCSLVGK